MDPGSKKKPMLDTILEEEETTTELQKEAIPGGKVSADISEDTPKDQIKSGKPESNIPDDEDNVVVIVDLVDIVRRNKEKGSANERDKTEGSHDVRLACEGSGLKPDFVQTRRDREKYGCPHEISVEEMKMPEKRNIDRDKKETPVSKNKGNLSLCSSGNERECYDDNRSQPETSRFQHPTGSVILNIDDMVENLPTNQSWASLFNWDDFGYSLILGFAPTAWDVYSDLTIANQLCGVECEDRILVHPQDTESGDPISAGLSYLFICFPGIYMFSEAFNDKLSSCSSAILIVISFSLSVSLTSAMIYTFYVDHLLFKYPAYLIGILVVITKGLAIFIHTPTMKMISERMTMGEFKTEAPLQLLLLLHLWVSGGPLFLTPILSSLLVIGKVNAEMYLSDEPDNLMKGKTFLQKLFLTLKYVPLFSSTAFFRVGCGIIKHSGPYANVSKTFHAFVFFVSVWAGSVFFILLYLLTFAGVKLAFPGSLADITIMELGRGILAEFTTVSNWGCLGRDRSK